MQLKLTFSLHGDVLVCSNSDKIKVGGVPLLKNITVVRFSIVFDYLSGVPTIYPGWEGWVRLMVQCSNLIMVA